MGKYHKQHRKNKSASILYKKQGRKSKTETLFRTGKWAWVCLLSAFFLLAFAFLFIFVFARRKPSSAYGVGSPILPDAGQSRISPPQASFENPIDFNALKIQNEDIIAWITIPGTVIDYPVVCTSDNTFYLTNNAFKKPDPGGAIFIDMSNPSDFSAPVMVVYGHFMPDESYFTQLHRYADKLYLEQNPNVTIFLPGKQLEFKVIAAFLTGPDNILYQRDFKNKKQMAYFIDWVSNPLQKGIASSEALATDDRFLVLSTCTKEAGDDRWLVVAKLQTTE